MPTRADSPFRDSLLQGTLDLLVLRILALGPHHGHGIAIAIQARSGDTLLVDHGSLYPALQRLEQRGWIRGAWGISDNNRRARFYTLTAAGRRQFAIETTRWNRLVESIGRVMKPGPTPTPTPESA
ncbi:MAG TPA: PadR family transcriptional regulator [Gemmatimonadaceae bacterium]|nr:PadR family transcriptional regulator [Gemmatimonadaceae bacterium]